ARYTSASAQTFSVSSTTMGPASTTAGGAGTTTRSKVTSRSSGPAVCKMNGMTPSATIEPSSGTSARSYTEVLLALLGGQSTSALDGLFGGGSPRCERPDILEIVEGPCPARVVLDKRRA